MTNGIEVRDKVRIKATGEVGWVVGIDDPSDRFPANLNVLIEMNSSRWSTATQGVHRMVRSDEVEKAKRICGACRCEIDEDGCGCNPIGA